MEGIRSPRLPMRAGALTLIVLALAACQDTPQPAGPEAGVKANTASAPAGLVTASWGGSSLTLWPYTSEDFTAASDPVNLLFFGNADPRAIRAALLSLDGDRTAYGLPGSYPFNCTWHDVPEGGIQATFADGTGWTGGAIQLGCGDFSPLRFHLRLFRAGSWTIGGVHFEFNVPGTTTHQVLSWEAAEQFVALDMFRTGIGAPVDSAQVNDAPGFRTIPAQLVGLLPPELKAVACPTGVPWPCDGSADVPIINNGYATIVYLWDGTSAATGSFSREQTIQFDQVIPKPFCAGGSAQYLYVTGPVRFREHWVLTPSNNYIATFDALGTLSLTPVDPTSGQPLGATYTAHVAERHRMQITDQQTKAASALMQMEIPPSAPFHGMLQVRFGVGSNGVTVNDVSLSCGS